MNDQPPPSIQRTRPCPVCDGDACAPAFTKGALCVVRCRACGMLSANPVPEEMASGVFYDRLAAPYYLSPDKLAGDYAPVRFQRELRWFRQYCAGGGVLDIGCSTGAFLHQLQARFPGGYDVLGADVAGPALDHAASRGVPVLRAPVLEHDFGGRQFDAITFWAVMEHLAEPARFLDRAAQLLRPGGHCFILVPNMRSLAVRLLGTRYRYIMPDHLNYFTPATLRALAARAPALSVVRLASTHFNPVVLWQDWRRAPARVAEADRARLLRRTTGWKQSRRLGPLRRAYTALESALGFARLADNLVLVLCKSSG